MTVYSYSFLTGYSFSSVVGGQGCCWDKSELPVTKGLGLGNSKEEKRGRDCSTSTGKADCVQSGEGRQQAKMAKTRNRKEDLESGLGV